MIQINEQTLPQTFLTYVAFRLAFLETVERFQLARQFELVHERSFGFLSHVPILAEVAPQVQLDILVETWSRHMLPDAVPATLLDDAVLYAVCETAARMVSDEAVLVSRLIRRGPVGVQALVDHQLASELRQLPLKYCSDGDFLLVSQFLDVDPDSAGPLREKFDLPLGYTECLFDALGRWSVSPEFAGRCEFLLTEREIGHACKVLGIATKERSAS